MQLEGGGGETKNASCAGFKFKIFYNKLLI